MSNKIKSERKHGTASYCTSSKFLLFGIDPEYPYDVWEVDPYSDGYRYINSYRSTAGAYRDFGDNFKILPEVNIKTGEIIGDN